MEIIVEIIFVLFGLIGIYKRFCNSCNNPAYDAWKIEDQAKYNWNDKNKID